MKPFYLSVTNKGSYILESIKNLDGSTTHQKVFFKPKAYIISKKHNTNLIPFPGNSPQKLSEVNFENVYEFREFVKTYDEIEDANIYGLKNPVQQYIYEKYSDLKMSDIDMSLIRVGFFDIELFSKIQENGELVSKGFPKPEESIYPINAICHYDSLSKKFYQFSLGDWSSTNSEFPDFSKDVIFKKCSSEKELLEEYSRFFIQNRPDVLIGYNSKTFDIPYLINRLKKKVSDKLWKQLSPFSDIKDKTVKTDWGNALTYEITGIMLLDYMELVKKYYVEEPLESYSLDYIGDFFLNRGKLDYEGSLDNLYLENPQKFNDYNINDVALLRDIDKKQGYVNLTFGIAYTAKVNFTDTMSPVKCWDSLMTNKCLDKNIVPKISNVHRTQETFPGAFVFANPGILYQIVSFDFESLYPSIIRSLNIGLDTLLPESEEMKHVKALQKIVPKELGDHLSNREIILEWLLNNYSENLETYLKENKLSLSASGNFFDISRKSLMAELMDEIFLTRKKHKGIAQDAKKKLKSEGSHDKELQNTYDIYNVSQGSLKVLLNAGYGAMGNAYFQFSDNRLVKSITMTAQLCTRTAYSRINQYINKILKNKEKKDYCVISDTDSVYFELKDVCEKFIPEHSPMKYTQFMDVFAKKIEEKALRPTYEFLGSSLNFYQNVLNMKREAICPGYGKNKASGICTAMKHYYLLVQDDEGILYPEGSEKEKITGLWSKQKGCPKWIKPIFNNTIRTLACEGPEISRKQIKKFALDFFAEKDYNKISLATSVSNVERYVDKKTGLPHSGSWFDHTLNKERNGGVPENSKSAIYYNNLLDKYKLDEIERIRDGDKIRILYLKENQYSNISSIAYKNILPKEFTLDKFIDYQKHYERLFYKPMNDIFKAVTEEDIQKKASLKDFF